MIRVPYNLLKNTMSFTTLGGETLAFLAPWLKCIFWIVAAGIYSFSSYLFWAYWVYLIWSSEFRNFGISELNWTELQQLSYGKCGDWCMRNQNKHGKCGDWCMHNQNKHTHWLSEIPKFRRSNQTHSLFTCWWK